MDSASIEAKKKLRRDVITLRDGIPASLRRRDSEIITQIVLESAIWKNSRVVMSYMSIGSEVDTTLINEAALRQGKILVLPRVNFQSVELLTYRVRDINNDLEENRWGIREPRVDLCMPMAGELVEFILVPGVVFDLKGGRIGYGKGFYDRFLATCKQNSGKVVTAGAAYGLQVKDSLPLMPDDVALDVIVTEKGWHDCRL